MPFMDNCAAPVPERPVGNTSGRMVHCVKFQKDLPALDSPPWPGELGQRIYENVSAQAWKLWEERQKMILNEYRLMPWQKEAQELIARHMEDFFFGAGAARCARHAHVRYRARNRAGAPVATSPAAAQIQAAAQRPPRRRNLPCAVRLVPALPSATASDGTH